MRSLTLGLLVLVCAGCNSKTSVPTPAQPDPTQDDKGSVRPAMQEMISGGGVGYQKFWFGAPNLFRDGGALGIRYSTYKVPMGKSQLAYVILFKFPATHRRFGNAKEHGVTSVGDGNVTIQDGQTINDQELAVRMTLFADTDSGKVTREELRAAGEKLDLSKGRLVLMDFTKDKPVWKQSDADLSKALAGIDVTDTEAMGKKGIAQIRQAAPDVDAFFK